MSAEHVRPLATKEDGIAAVEALPINTLFKIGWLLPRGSVQASLYLRSRDGVVYCGPPRDGSRRIDTIVTPPREGQPLGLEIVASPVAAVRADQQEPTVRVEARNLKTGMVLSSGEQVVGIASNPSGVRVSLGSGFRCTYIPEFPFDVRAAAAPSGADQQEPDALDRQRAASFIRDPFACVNCGKTNEACALDIAYGRGGCCSQGDHQPDPDTLAAVTRVLAAAPSTPGAPEADPCPRCGFDRSEGYVGHLCITADPADPVLLSDDTTPAAPPPAVQGAPGGDE